MHTLKTPLSNLSNSRLSNLIKYMEKRSLLIVISHLPANEKETIFNKISNNLSEYLHNEMANFEVGTISQEDIDRAFADINFILDKLSSSILSQEEMDELLSIDKKNDEIDFEIKKDETQLIYNIDFFHKLKVTFNIFYFTFDFDNIVYLNDDLISEFLDKATKQSNFKPFFYNLDNRVKKRLKKFLPKELLIEIKESRDKKYSRDIYYFFEELLNKVLFVQIMKDIDIKFYKSALFFTEAETLEFIDILKDTQNKITEMNDSFEVKKEQELRNRVKKYYDESLYFIKNIKPNLLESIRVFMLKVAYYILNKYSSIKPPNRYLLKDRVLNRSEVVNEKYFENIPKEEIVYKLTVFSFITRRDGVDELVESFRDDEKNFFFKKAIELLQKYGLHDYELFSKDLQNLKDEYLEELNEKFKTIETIFNSDFDEKIAIKNINREFIDEYSIKELREKVNFYLEKLNKYSRLNIENDANLEKNLLLKEILSMFVDGFEVEEIVKYFNLEKNTILKSTTDKIDMTILGFEGLQQGQNPRIQEAFLNTFIERRERNSIF